MAPLSKESEAVLTPNAALPPAPAAKAPEANKAQPVAIEIPVTINGAHTVNGSGKREPFSESTNTVLLFAHGAVVRMNTALAPGQLVFLTNEKTKKEIVCQAVKSKAGGSNTYVELKFTEPAPGFWGIRTQATADTPVATARPPKAPSVPAVMMPKIEVAKEAKPANAVAPLAIAPPPAPVVVPPVPVVPPPTDVDGSSARTGLPEMPSLTSALLAAAPKSVPSLAPPAPSPATERSIAPPLPEASSEQSNSTTVSEPAEQKLPAATFKDFSKEIDALFGVPMSPSVRPPAPTVSDPEPKDTSTLSTQELKVHTAELQTKLSAMIFSETPASAPAPPQSTKEVPAESTAPSPDGLTAKLLEFAQEQPKPFVETEPDAVPILPTITPKPVLPSLSADDEVKIPAWLAPLSQSSESPANEPVNSDLSSSGSGAEIRPSTEDLDDSHGDAVRRSQASVFGGQLLGEAAPSASNSGRSKSGVVLTLAAAALLLVAAAAWYFLYGPGAPSNATTHPTHITSSTQQPQSAEPQTAVQEQQPESTPTVSTVNPARTDSLMASPLPSKPSSVASSPAVFNPPPERRPANPPPQQVVAAEPPKKPALGDVHLAAPVVNRGSRQTFSDAEPAIETSAPATGVDAATAFTRGNSPDAPRPVGGDVKPAQLMKSVAPEYPQIAKAQHIAGSVQIDALVDASGKVVEVKAISGPQLLYRAALDAVKQWKYSPATLNGEPTSMHLTVVVQFRAQ